METCAPFEMRAENIVKFTSGNANYCSINDAGTIAVATSSGGCAMAVDMSKARKNMITVFEGHNSSVQQCTISAFGLAAATASMDGSVQVWNTENPLQVWKKLTCKGYNRALGVAISRNGNRIAASFQRLGDKQCIIQVYSMPDFRLVHNWKVVSQTFSGAIAISDDGNLVASCSLNKVIVMNVKAARHNGVKTLGSYHAWKVKGQSHVAMSGDGGAIAIADERELRVISIPQRSEFSLPGYERSFRAFCCINAVGNRVAAAIAGNKFRVWNVTGEIIADIGGFHQHARGCSISENGNLLLMCGYDGTVRITNLEKDPKYPPNHFDEDQVHSDEPQFFDVDEISQNKEVDIKESEENAGKVTEHLHESEPLEKVPLITEQIEVDENRNAEKIKKQHEVAMKMVKNSAKSSLVQNMVEKIEKMKNMDEEERHEKNPRLLDLPQKFTEHTDGEANANIPDKYSEAADTVQSEEEQSVPSGLITRKNPRNVFSNALYRYGRTEDASLLHVQASEALDDMFSEEDIEKLPKYFKDDALLSVDIDRRWKINEVQFVEAAFRMMTEIQASNTDQWTAAFTTATESKENNLTVPQAAMIINEVLDDDAPSREDVFEALENAADSEDDINFEAFLEAIKILGYSE